MTKIRRGQAPAQLSRIQFHDRFALSFKDPMFGSEEGALARVEDVAWKAYKDSPRRWSLKEQGRGDRRIAMVEVSAGAVAGYKVMSKPKFADVVAVIEVTETVVIRARNVRTYTCRGRPRRWIRIASPATGSAELRAASWVARYWLGRGRTVATIAGAAGGAYVGNHVQKNVSKRTSFDDANGAARRSTTRRSSWLATTSAMARGQGAPRSLLRLQAGRDAAG